MQAGIRMESTEENRSVEIKNRRNIRPLSLK